MFPSITTAGEQVDFQYGGDNRQVLKTFNDQGSVTFTFYLHGENAYPLLEKNRVNSLPETRVVYIYGLTGLIAMQKNGAVYYVLKDHLGSTRVLVDETGTVAAYYDYAPFGNLMRSGVNTEIYYLFTGQEYDAESGLHNFRARLYDSDLGRFYAVDAAGQFASPFLYAGNNPVVYVDPDGEFIIEAIIAFNLIYTAYQGYQAGGWGGAFSAFTQAAIITGFSMGLAAPVGSAVYGLTGSATLSLAASSTVSSTVGGFVANQRISPTTDLGFGSIDWGGGGFRWAFSGSGLSDVMDAWSIAGANLQDAIMIGQKIQHSLSAEAQANIARAKSYMIPANQDPEDPNKYILSENFIGEKAEKLPDDKYMEAVAKYAPEARDRATIFDPIARKVGFPPDVQKSSSSEHIRGYRVLGGAHYGYDQVKPGVHLYRWRVHFDKFDALALGGFGAVGHWFYESVTPLVRFFRARAIWGYGYY